MAKAANAAAHSLWRRRAEEGRKACVGGCGANPRMHPSECLLRQVPHHLQNALAAVTAPAPTLAPAPTVPMPLALLNGVTGPHNLPTAKVRAKKQATMQENVQLASRRAEKRVRRMTRLTKVSDSSD